MSRKSKQTKNKAPAQKPKPSSNQQQNSSGKGRKQQNRKKSTMDPVHCTLLDPAYSNPKCPFKVQYEQPLPPMRGVPNTVQGAAGSTSFALVIFPQYFTDPTALGSNGSMGVSAYGWSTTGSNTTINPTFGDNWATNPFQSTTSNQIWAIKNPGIDTITAVNLEGFRTWAACIKFITTVAASSMAGQIAVVYDLTAEQILQGGVTDKHISISDIFNMARPEDTHRLASEHMFCYAPEEPDSIIRRYNDHPITLTRSGTTPIVWDAQTSFREELRASKAIVIAVRGASEAVLGALSINETIRVEPSYGSGSGYVKALPTYSTKGPDDHARELSRRQPNWRSMGNKLLKAGIRAAEDNLPGLIQKLILGTVL